jgi:hypothetical protein
MNNSESEQRFEIGAEATIVVETTSGDVRVHGWAQPYVGLESREDRAHVEQSEAGLRIKSGTAGTNDLNLNVPKDCALELHVVSGDAHLQDVSGQISVQSMSGDVRGQNLRGELRAHTVSGDVKLRGSHLTRLAIDTVSGDSLIESPIDEGGSYEVRSVSGNLRLLVPEDQRCTVRVHTLSGEFSSRLRHEVRHQGWGKQEALINGGGTEVHFHTTSGSAAVAPAEVLPEGQPAPAATQPADTGRKTRPMEPEQAQPAAEQPFSLDSATTSQDAASTTAAKRMAILKAIEEGKLSVSEGLARLRALE